MPEFYHARTPQPPQEGKPRIFLATPAIQLYPAHVASLVRALPRVVGSGVAIDYFLLANAVHVDDARNICVAAFLKSDCEHLLFIDADIGFTPEGLFRICTLEGDILAGVYPRKELARSYPIVMEGEKASTDEQGLIKEGVESVPAGFLRISRKVIEHMAEVNMAKGFRSPETGENVPLIFERVTKHGNRCSGDVAFCMAARALGYSITVDALQEFIHEGPMRFAGCMLRDFAGPQEHVNGQ